MGVNGDCKASPKDVKVKTYAEMIVVVIYIDCDALDRVLLVAKVDIGNGFN